MNKTDKKALSAIRKQLNARDWTGVKQGLDAIAALRDPEIDAVLVAGMTVYR